MKFTQQSLLVDYFDTWIRTYKEGTVRPITLQRYRMTSKWLRKIVPTLTLTEVDRNEYQQIINQYAETHEKQTVMDFHHQVKAAVLDAVDEGLIPRNPTRRIAIKGKAPRDKKIKFLNQFELQTLLKALELKPEVSKDWLILLIAKTGMRFAEALAITPKDFDFVHQTLSITKTWDYKGDGGFSPTKNKSSVRKIQIDWKTLMQFFGLVQNLTPEEPIFVKPGQKIYNSTINDFLAAYCRKLDIPTISVHGLRHTHASILLYAGVSIASVSRRLGHSSMTTTQKVYLHLIKELEDQDVDLIMRSLANI